MSDPMRDALIRQRDRLAELSAAADELVRRYDAMTDPPLFANPDGLRLVPGDNA